MTKKKKMFIALALIPSMWSSMRFGLEMLYEASTARAWPWKESLWFLSGFFIWCVIYKLFPRPMKWYVFAHEATHALAILSSGGKIFQFHVTARGGHVLTNKTSAWIALSPYLVPLYPLVLGLIGGLTFWLWEDSRNFFNLFLLLWGISWGFHYCFTFTVMKTEQSDFSSQGYIFSAVTICLVNWWILITSVALMTRIYSPLDFITSFWSILISDYWGLLQFSAHWLWQGMHALFSLFKTWLT